MNEDQPDFMSDPLLTAEEAIAYFMKGGLTREEAEAALDRLDDEGKYVPVQ